MTMPDGDVRELAQRGYRFALALTHDPDQAEDVLQDAWYRVLHANGPLTAGYLFSTVRNRFIDLARRDKLAAGLTGAGFDVLPSAGTYFLCADSRPLGEPDAAALAQRLPEEAGVVAIPLSAFSASPTPETNALLRFAFCKRADVLDARRAIQRLKLTPASAPASRREETIAVRPSSVNMGCQSSTSDESSATTDASAKPAPSRLAM